MRSLALLALALGGARAFMTVPKERAEVPASAVASGAEDFGAPEKALPLAPSKDSKDWTLPLAPPKDSKDGKAPPPAPPKDSKYWKSLPPAPPKDGKALPPSPTAKRPEVPPPPPSPSTPALSPPPPPPWYTFKRFASGADCRANGCYSINEDACEEAAAVLGGNAYYPDHGDSSVAPTYCMYGRVASMPGVHTRYFWNGNYDSSAECSSIFNCVCRCPDNSNPGRLNSWTIQQAAAAVVDTWDFTIDPWNIEEWDVSLVDDFSDVFVGARSFDADLSKWDVSQGTNFMRMFSGANSFNADISRWDVAKGTNFAMMLAGAESFNQDLSEWNLSQATRLDRMFQNSGMDDANHCPATQQVVAAVLEAYWCPA